MFIKLAFKLQRMKYLFISVCCAIFMSCQAQIAVRHDYFETDFSPYDTYMIKSFRLNGKEIDHEFSIRTRLLVDKLHQKMKKFGFDHSEEGDFYFTYNMKVDTLPIGFQRPSGPLPEDVVADITIEIFDEEYDERLFVGNIYGLLVEDKKNGNTIKKTYKKLFRDLEN